MYKRILVPIDGSKTSLEALKHAVELCQLMQSKLILLNVIEDYTEQVGEIYFDYDKFESELRQQSKTFLEQAAEQAKKLGLAVELISILLKPFGDRIPNSIVEEAQKLSVDLIAIGSHGRHGIEHFLIGSVAEGVMRLTDIPVLLIHGPKED